MSGFNAVDAANNPNRAAPSRVVLETPPTTVSLADRTNLAPFRNAVAATITPKIRTTRIQERRCIPVASRINCTIVNRLPTAAEADNRVQAEVEAALQKFTAKVSAVEKADIKFDPPTEMTVGDVRSFTATVTVPDGTVLTGLRSAVADLGLDPKIVTGIRAKLQGAAFEIKDGSEMLLAPTGGEPLEWSWDVRAAVAGEMQSLKIWVYAVIEQPGLAEAVNQKIATADRTTTVIPPPRTLLDWLKVAGDAASSVYGIGVLLSAVIGFLVFKRWRKPVAR